VFCTYSHSTPQGRLFYIGKGSSHRRAYYMQGRNNYWNKIVAKYGKPTVQVLADWKTEVEAFEHEKFLIACFRDMGYELANLTDGGDGTSGYKQTEEHKKKLQPYLLGNKRALGHKVSDEAKKLMGADKIGKPTSAKQKAVSSAIFKGNKFAGGNTNNRKWVWIGTHIETGEVIRLVGEQAMKDAGVQHANVIKCLNGNRKSHKGYTWRRELWEGKEWH